MHSATPSTRPRIRRAAAALAAAALLCLAAPSYAAGGGPLEPSLRGSVDRALESLWEWLHFPVPFTAWAPAESSDDGTGDDGSTDGTDGESGSDGGTTDPDLGGPGGGTGLMDPNG